MAAQVTKKDLKEISVSIGKAMDKRFGGFERSMNKRFEDFGTSADRRFDNFERTMVQAVDKQLQDFEQKNNAHFYVIETRFGNLDQRMEEFDRKLDRLMNALDAFLKRLTDFDDEFTILKAEVDLIKDILKEKLGVEVALQR